MWVFLVLVLGRVRFDEGVQGGGVGTAGLKGVEEPLPSWARSLAGETRLLVL